MRVLVVLTLAVLVAPAVSGCLTVAPPEPQPAATSLLPDLSDLGDPPVDARRARLWWEEFVMNHPGRHVGSPTNIQASEQLAANLETAGWEAEILRYVPGTGDVSPVDGFGIRAVVGVKRGSVEPDRVVAWVSHYDSQRGTVYAAYDDGSGNAVGMELARAFSGYDNRKTLMVIFFDAEEIGLVASDYFVRQALRDASVKFSMVIGHDMVGINCPDHEWPMYQMVGENFADVLVPIEEALYVDHLGLDVGLGEEARNCIVILDVHDRNSDERRFKEAGIPILRMAGGRKAVDYPEYHKPGDTVPFVYEFAGGAESFERGLDTVLRTSWWNVVVFDRLPSLV